jgi:hypothetical protein
MKCSGFKTAALMLGVALCGAACSPDDVSSLSTGSGESKRKTGVLLIESRPVITYEEVNGELIFNGDMALRPSQVGPLPSAGGELGTNHQELLTHSTIARWPHGIVYYTLAPDLSSTLRAKITDAINHWMSRTPLQFVPREGQADYVTFRYTTAGYAYADLGRQGGQQFINLGEANPVGVIVHEMGHTLGLLHEHTRPDRDTYVNIIWGNVRAGLEENFHILTDGTRVGPYDEASIMHYPSYELSANGGPTILRKDGSTVTASYAGLSTQDVSSIKQLYGFTNPILFVDDDNAYNNAANASFEASANWRFYANAPGYYKVGYHAASTGVTADTATFSFYLASAGTRTIDARWTEGSNRSDRAPFVINNSSGTELARIYKDQRSNGGYFVPLGTWSFTAGWNKVQVSRNTTEGANVIADAIRVR